MQQALPYKTWAPPPPQPPPTSDHPHSLSLSLRSTPLNLNYPTAIDVGGVLRLEGRQSMIKMVSENAVLVFGKRGCCMSYVVNKLLLGLGVNPLIYEVSDEDDELEIIIGSFDGKDGRLELPVVFIGGRLFGGLDQLMATHITGELVPVLKKAGALWL